MEILSEAYFFFFFFLTNVLFMEMLSHINAVYGKMTKFENTGGFNDVLDFLRHKM